MLYPSSGADQFGSKGDRLIILDLNGNAVDYVFQKALVYSTVGQGIWIPACQEIETSTACMSYMQGMYNLAQHYQLRHL